MAPARDGPNSECAISRPNGPENQKLIIRRSTAIGLICNMSREVETAVFYPSRPKFQSQLRHPAIYGPRPHGTDTLCAVWHHSRPHRRLWTNPAVLDIYILRSPRSATQMCCPGSRLRSPATSSELGAISAGEITGDCGRSQSRARTARLSS